MIADALTCYNSTYSPIEMSFIGVYATIFVPTAYLIWNNRRDWAFRNGLRLLSAAFVVLFALATTHFVLTLSMLFNSLANEEYISNSDGAAQTASTVIWIFMLVIADTIVVSLQADLMLSPLYRVMSIFDRFGAAGSCGIKGLGS
jgi:cell shape-determining protein MreD